jgi:hypothetical protein
MTLIGNGSADGVKLRRGTRATIHNAVIAGFSKCVDIDDADTFAHGAAGDIAVQHSVFDCDDVFKVKSDDPATADVNEADPANAADTFAAILEDADAGNSSAAVATILTDATNRSAPDFRVKAGSAAATGAVTPSDPFFDVAAFVGAVGENDWTAGWTAFPAN